MRTIDNSCVSCPPANVAGPLKQIPVNQFHRIEGKIDEAFALGLVGHCLDAMLKINNPLRQIDLELGGYAFDATPDRSHFLCHDRKSRTVLTGTRRFDHRVQGENFHLPGHLPDAAGLLRREFAHFGSDVSDVLQLDPRAVQR